MRTTWSRVAGPVGADGWVLDVDDPAHPTRLAARRERSPRARPRVVPYPGPCIRPVTLLVRAGVPWPYANALAKQLAAALPKPSRRRTAD